MTIPNKFMLNTHFDFVNKGPVYDFFSEKMALFLSSFWFSIATFMVTLFRVLTRYLFRFPINESSPRKNFYSADVLLREENHIDSNKVEEIPELEVIDYEESEYDGFGDKETTPTSPKFSFKFQFQNYEDTRRSSGDFTASTSKYEFLPKNVFSGFMEEPGVVSFSVKEMFLNSNEDYVDNKVILEDEFLSEKDFLQNTVEDDHEEIINNSHSGEDFEKPESVVLTDVPMSEKEQPVIDSQEKGEFSDEAQFLSENELSSSDSEPEPISLWDKFSVMVNKIESDDDEFLSDGDFVGAEPKVSEEMDERKTEPLEVLENSVQIRPEAFQNSENIHLNSQGALDEGGGGISSPTSLINPEEEELTDLSEVLDMINDIQKLEELNLPSLSILETDSEIEGEFSKIQAECEQEGSERNGIDTHLESEEVPDRNPVQNINSGELRDLDEILEMIDDIEELEQFSVPNSSNLVTDAHIERQFSEIQAECELEDSSKKEIEKQNNVESSGESSMKASISSDVEEANNLECLWEHQDLIEQLKMEIRKVKATGLPTIFEESESPKMSEDLKPWKIDEKFAHADQMDGLHKFYQSYKERMRKFDILNYQKMYAMGFLQLKGPLQSIPLQKSSGPTLTSVLSQNRLLPKSRKPVADSSAIFIKELTNDLEMVYVGQMCLSWEFLNWQYGKAKELLASDPYEIRPYNNVAGEFQQFQVLMQRFLENEPFQGPRVHNYIKNRCVLRNLLQVPVIKEGPKKKSGENRSKEDITCSMLLVIIEECIRVFWEFVRADRAEGNLILKGLSGPQGKVLNPADTKLWMDVQTSLQKKEKKLKDILRSGNCIVKKFQKQPKAKQSDQLLFFSQIDLKLVARVLRMSRITSDQLAWCQAKLDGIYFVDRKIHVEPSFLLFPC